MKRSKQLRGNKIIDSNSGKVIGKTYDVVFLVGEKELMGFLVKCGKWFNNHKILKIEDIVHTENNYIIVRDKCTLHELKKYPDFKEALEEKNKTAGRIVITIDGYEMGYIEDIIINETNYLIEGYILTDGIIEDIISGKTIIPYNNQMLFRNDSIILNSNNIMVLKNDISIKKLLKKDRRLNN